MIVRAVPVIWKVCWLSVGNAFLKALLFLYIDIWKQLILHNMVTMNMSVQVCKYFKYFKYSNTQIFKYSNTQIFKYSNIQIPKYLNTQRPKYPNTQLLKYKWGRPYPRGKIFYLQFLFCLQLLFFTFVMLTSIVIFSKSVIFLHFWPSYTIYIVTNIVLGFL